MHRSVMLQEVIEYLNIKPGSKIIDATLNGGGHSKGILERYPEVKILGIEFDPKIFQEFQSAIRNSQFADRIIPVNDSYVNLKKITEKYDFKPDGIIFDLGVSSWHYEIGRGFSFMKDEILDMRFNPNVQEKTAAEIVNQYSEKDLKTIISEYGEEKFADQIAKGIIKARQIKPIIRTFELVEVIIGSVPAGYIKRKIHPATKTFQALRIETNGELDNVENGIRTAIEVLKPGGRLIVISFHGLEDKIVRNIFRQKAGEGVVKWAIKGTIRPKWEEVRQNPRARSAKMKIIEKF